MARADHIQAELKNTSQLVKELRMCCEKMLECLDRPKTDLDVSIPKEKQGSSSPSKKTD